MIFDLPRTWRACLSIALCGCTLLSPRAAWATDSVAAPSQASTAKPGDDFSFMRVLAARGEHDLEHEPFQAYGQFTYISRYKAPFRAAYTNLNGSNHSLSNKAEHSFTATATLFLGVHLWPGAEAYLVPEVSQYALPLDRALQKL